MILKNKNIKNNIIFTILFFFFISIFCNIQTLAFEDNISIKINPEFPGANQNVSVSIESYVIDLDRAEIIWYKNNVIKQRGVGLKKFNFNTRGLGTSDTVTVQVNSSDVGLLTENINISPVEVDLVWESESRVPPFYKGKALSSQQSRTRIIAIPNFVSSRGEKISPKNLVYTWKKDWKVLGNYSGYGKDILIIDRLHLFTDTLISVEVETIDYFLKAKKSVVIKSYDPKIIFYEKNPLLGTIYENAITNTFSLKDEEITITAFPFFFSIKDGLKYNWVMNNKKLVDLEKEKTITLRQKDDIGIANLFLEVQNLDRIMQFAKNSFGISFGETQKTPIFGEFGN